MFTFDKRGKSILLIIILLSFLPLIILPFNFLQTRFILFGKDFIWAFGSWLGLIGYLFIFWQSIFGIKQITYFFTQDLITINKIHKFFGIYGFILILLHPIILFVDFLFKHATNLLNIDFTNVYDTRIQIGKLVFLILFIIFFSSVYLRNKLTYRYWKSIHFLNFLILPLIYIHADEIGVFLDSKQLSTYIKIILLIFILSILIRLALQLGIFKYKYKIQQITRLSHDTMKIDLAPTNRHINPKPGQFINIQKEIILGESHPFTVSHYDELTKTISISIKESGRFSKELMGLKKGEVIFIDGSYGIFTRIAYIKNTSKIIIIAGGIGITPFLRLIYYAKKNPKIYSGIYLFNGNKTEKDLIFQDDLKETAELPQYRLINVLSKVEVQSKYETGYINTTLIKKYVTEDLSSYNFFICGPSVMMEKLTADLLLHQVSIENIHKEEFTL